MNARLTPTTRASAITLLLAASLALGTACGGPTKPATPGATTAPTQTPAATAGTATAAATTAPTVRVASLGALGSTLTDASGRTLYIFTTDGVATGKSACTGGCAAVWPPLVAASGEIANPEGVTGAFRTITRDDGSRQVTYA